MTLDSDTRTYSDGGFDPYTAVNVTISLVSQEENVVLVSGMAMCRTDEACKFTIVCFLQNIW